MCPEKIVLSLRAVGELDVIEQISLRLLVMFKRFGTIIRQTGVFYELVVRI